MTVDFDPRPWNLLAGLAMAAGCGSRTISLDGDSTDSINDGETTLDPDSGTDSSTECVDASDCPSGYYCYNGVCEYAPVSDGEPNYDCYSDADCSHLQVCDNFCQYVDGAPLCDLVLPQGPVFEILEPVLALAFVDVDNDGARELVAATQTQLHVIESGSPTPASHPRGIESSSVDAMVGGAFDMIPGEDVILLHDDELDLHGSDGLGNLLPAQPAMSMSPYPLLRGLAAGAFDAEPTTDLLAWGDSGTAVIYGSGQHLDLLDGPTTSASARELGLPGNGFTLLANKELLFLDIDGSLIGSVVLRGDSPLAQAGLDSFGEPLELGSSLINEDWTLIEVFDRQTVSMTGRWAVDGRVMQMRSGDLDGIDDADELALVIEDALWLLVGGDCLLPIPLDGAAVHLAFGDHDGDGDDELAVSTDTNTVSIIDVE